MLKVNQLTKTYDKIKAVDNISFHVKDGEIAVLLGPNGAGKSTTIKSIAGLLRYDGDIIINDMPNKSIEAKRIFGYVPEAPAVFDMLTIEEHIKYIASAYKMKNYKAKAKTLLEAFDLWDKKDKLGTSLSKGMKQKVSICCALLFEPRVILFDEPMIGLDPKAIKTLKDAFLKLRNSGCTILISTHIIDSVEEVWDRALIMKDGKIVLSRTREELANNNESLEDIFFHVTEGSL
ncbi:ABC transporter ATP-binding protein [Vallitalea pronyensis]|uniref:ABC transporter ATP-binding protein n=1 Tax=Vallitalea pronyensis TaxID=1348613 RepID=A0A8J8SFP8_9FIRM|nr:ABC transporter ATP-binding protein [Vallitalea pronyensis]QUI21554.1 ABC transporter ATP-binding protein [Vallitalea pronyensis]